MRTTLRIDHFARVEGHGGVTVEMDGDVVSDVRFDVFEGARLIEPLVRGRSFEDVPQIVSRICSICSVAHCLTSIKATERAFGIDVRPVTETLRDLMFLGENIESHALHLFLLALPDYLGYPSATAMAADHPEAVRTGLRLKQLGNSLQEVIGGRAIHPVNAVPGGFGRVPTVDQLLSLHRALVDAASDCETAVDIMRSLPSTRLCRGPVTFAALVAPSGYGYYSGDEIAILNGGVTRIPAQDYRSLTNEKPVPHSHAKHSLFKGRPFMVGALARLAVNSRVDEQSKRMIAKLELELPSDDPMNNNKAQMVELAGDIHRALEKIEWLLDRGFEQLASVPVRPRAGAGTAVTEAPRGLLVHSYVYDAAGRLETADIITPTAMNAASIEQSVRRAAEQAETTDAAELQKRLEMVVRAYDPCISCSVHLMRTRDAT